MTPVPELDAHAIYEAAERKKRGKKISWREAAAEAHLCSTHTFTRLGRGMIPSPHNLFLVLLWIGLTDLRTWQKQPVS